MDMSMPPAGLKSALFSDSGFSDQSRIQSLMEDIFRHSEDPMITLDDRVSVLSQVLYLMYLARARKASSIAEIGFSIGYSSIAFLESSPGAQVTSFEIHNEALAKSAKEFIDSRYPDRHHLIYGDSTHTVPAFEAPRSTDGFDLVFVDGAHEYPTVKADIANARRLARPGATIVVNSLTPWFKWGIGPTTAWDEAVRDGIVTPLEYVSNACAVSRIQGPVDRAWAVGQFQ
ncbi:MULTISPECIES: O-methyltransferase [Micromonospora]|uniref:Class I SAM-dependent methyltransferase n=1 Tax=Micromonospora antibiotica TaxID=2807623 RepID=A0ABS3V8Q3_9ACTN|nr:class I SAM-dependent methyltransferase [Micromonospora antibiotica]MBO4161996.1 class I SAM-dependent methyltransferase [Micromonospora antibiotica]